LWGNVVDNKLNTKSLPVVKEEVAVDPIQEVINDYRYSEEVTNDYTEEV
jgi:hypothetical protein